MWGLKKYVCKISTDTVYSDNLWVVLTGWSFCIIQTGQQSVSLIIWLVIPLPDIQTGIRIISRQLQAGLPNFGVVFTSHFGMQSIQGLVSGAFPRWSSGDPEDQSSIDYQEHSQNIYKYCLRGRVLILRIVPLLWHNKQTNIVLLYSTVTSYQLFGRILQALFYTITYRPKMSFSVMPMSATAITLVKSSRPL